jgi:ferritin-like metal-binding protein YciE
LIGTNARAWFNATLAEEKKADETLTKIAQESVNQHAEAA